MRACMCVCVCVFACVSLSLSLWPERDLLLVARDEVLSRRVAAMSCVNARARALSLVNVRARASMRGLPKVPHTHEDALTKTHYDSAI